MSYHDGAYNPASFNERSEYLPERAAAFPTVAPPHYTPLRFAPSLDIPARYPNLQNYSSVENIENVPPMAAPRSNRGRGAKSKKRKHDEAHHAANDKRLRPDGLPTNARPNVAFPQHYEDLNGLPQGSQYNPVEIESSPEPEPHPKSRRQVVDQAQPTTSGFDLRTRLIEAGLYIQGPDTSAKKPKYYAVPGGHTPGIYTDWASVEGQIRRFSGAKQKKFATQSEAWDYIIEHQDIVMMSFDRKAQGSGEPVRRPATPRAPQSTWSAAYDQATQSSPWSEHDFSSFSASDLSRTSETFGSPPPYTFYDGYTASGSGSQPIMPNYIASDPEPTLSAEQQRVVDLIVQGHNVFYTGSAGCGKSTILKAFVKVLRHRGKEVRIVAPTNLAALNVNGQTTWNYAGWTPDSFKKSMETLENAAHGKEVWARFNTTDVLVIDEISMVENLMFERLHRIMKASRGRVGPFGGIQLIVTGDFCQLSPVKPFKHCIGCGWELIPDNKRQPKQYQCENKSCREDVFYDIDKWAFRSKAWEECNFRHINLTEIHRQNDKPFIGILQKIRKDGIITGHHGRILRVHELGDMEGAIKIFSLREDVDGENNKKISEIPSEPLFYRCVDHFSWKSHHREEKSLEKYNREAHDGTGTLQALKEHRYEIFVQLKEGMRVVLQANLDPGAGLVNGSQGVIVGFEPYDGRKLPRKDDGGVMPGAPTVRGAHAKYYEHQIKIYADRNNRQPWPIVQFDIGRRQTIYADCTASELGNKEPYSLLSRTQIPLMAGYAITVHKSQGMTLDRVIVDLKRAFEPSQLYVALSRARSLKGLKVNDLPTTDLGGANAEVTEFGQRFLGIR